MKPLNKTIPPRFAVKESTHQLSIEFQLSRIEDAITAVALLGFLCCITYFFWSSSTFETFGAFLKTELSGMLGLIWLVFGMAWVILLARALNSVEISTDKKVLTFRKKPIPLWDNYTFKASEVTQLYVTRHQTKSYRIFYSLVVEETNGNYKYVLERIPTYEEALFLERKIEIFLTIEDKKRGREYDPSGTNSK